MKYAPKPPTIPTHVYVDPQTKRWFCNGCLKWFPPNVGYEHVYRTHFAGVWMDTPAPEYAYRLMGHSVISVGFWGNMRLRPPPPPPDPNLIQVASGSPRALVQTFRRKS